MSFTGVCAFCSLGARARSAYVTLLILALDANGLTVARLAVGRVGDRGRCRGRDRRLEGGSRRHRGSVCRGSGFDWWQLSIGRTRAVDPLYLDTRWCDDHAVRGQEVRTYFSALDVGRALGTSFPAESGMRSDERMPLSLSANRSPCKLGVDVRRSTLEGRGHPSAHP